MLAAAAPAAAATTERALRGGSKGEAAATADGGDSPARAAPRNKTTVTNAIPPHKVGRISVPNAAKGMTLSRIAYGSLHFPEFEGEAMSQSSDVCIYIYYARGCYLLLLLRWHPRRSKGGGSGMCVHGRGLCLCV